MKFDATSESKLTDADSLPGAVKLVMACRANQFLGFGAPFLDDNIERK